MKLIDQVTLAEIQLPNDLLWQDELSWVPVKTQKDYSVTGALIVQPLSFFFTLNAFPSVGAISNERQK